ncbi:MerR family transcriptional regulator [Amycolatopsis roodepoortensis]|uniref:MerR family transcriptional regulator n=1 Tax=Amycolatopsis roodepoortensis TaxID=700274 RepID=UPI00214C84A6|nr:MerR family transcriptional regulator [Amycolatopsis roodepoortensis]UUV35954.1 MerR family transcriptional regulator [Amycolatopsis roodepoortensis]
MKSSATDPSIGEVAQRFGLATHVLRHWESMGLLAPARATASRRRYGSDDIYRVAVILRAKEAGFGLEDIRELFDARDPAARTGLLRRHRTELAARIAAAQASLELIDCALDCDHEDIVSCPHFQAAVTARINPPSAPNALI